jgi:hypothetical protein
MLGTNPKTMNTQGNEKGSRHDHAERKALLTQEPVLAVRYPLPESIHHSHPGERCFPCPAPQAPWGAAAKLPPSPIAIRRRKGLGAS